MKRDVAATEEANFFEPGSYIALDGRHVLKGLDWKERKGELFKRSGGRCEYINSDGERCRSEAAIPSHIIPRHPKRDDRLSNLAHQCIFHDQLTEAQSWRKPRWGEGKTEFVKRMNQ